MQHFSSPDLATDKFQKSAKILKFPGEQSLHFCKALRLNFKFELNFSPSREKNFYSVSKFQIKKTYGKKVFALTLKQIFDEKRDN